MYVYYSIFNLQKFIFLVIWIRSDNNLFIVIQESSIVLVSIRI